MDRFASHGRGKETYSRRAFLGRTAQILGVNAIAPLRVQSTPPAQTTMSAFTTAANWPLYLASAGGYYAKNGLDVRLAFGAQPTPMAMLLSGQADVSVATLDQALTAGSRDGSLVAVASTCRKTLFAMIVPATVNSVAELRGKRIAISQFSDATYGYAVKILQRYGIGPRDVEWIVVGTNGRAAALTSGRADATMLGAPAYFRVEEEGYKSIANISEFDDVYTPTVMLTKKTTLVARPDLCVRFVKAHAEAIRRFYDDQSYAIETFMAYENQNRRDVERVYAAYAGMNAFERVPYILEPAVRYSVGQQSDERIAQQLKSIDLRTVIEHRIVSNLIREGFFESVFGAGVRAEQKEKERTAFR